MSPGEPLPRLGFIGFGEAAYHIVKGLRAGGWPPVMAWDIHAKTVGPAGKILARAEETETKSAASSADLTAHCDWILSAVTADQAVVAATDAAASLEPRHIYIDVNSISPGRKQEIDTLVRATGARFVEVAIMAPVPPWLHKVPMLASGPDAAGIRSVLESYGMRIEITGDKIGAAAAIKMCRSIMVKGIEALLTECVLAATNFGAAEKVLMSLGETFPGIDWIRQANYNSPPYGLERRSRAESVF